MRPAFVPKAMPEPIGSHTPVGNESTEIGSGQVIRSAIAEDPGWQNALMLLSKQSTSQLQEVLRDRELLEGLNQSVNTRHPSHQNDIAAVARMLSSNTLLAQAVAHEEELLVEKRTRVENNLLTLHALERQWRGKQANMDRALDPFSPQSLYRQLANSVTEADDMSERIVEAFLSEDSSASDRETSDWVRAMRESRTRYWKRRARKERWDEGKVGGWR